MKIPLTKYGLPQVVVLPAIIAGVMLVIWLAGPALLPSPVIIGTELAAAILLVWVLSFFRDPPRKISGRTDILLSPADGCITDIGTDSGQNYFEGPAIKIGIFLNIFDVHINRAPCNAAIEKITYKPGRFKNAASPGSGDVNESNDVVMKRLDSPCDRIVVRQISGAIARRIVCEAAPGQEFTGGQTFGMIKFGSRTELYLPVRKNAECVVRQGDKVKAGLSVLVRYK